MVKTQIHQFNPVIYPVKLWITKTHDFLSIKNKFSEINGDDINFSVRDSLNAMTYNRVILSRKTNEYGILITIKSNISTNVIAHEATHAARFIWDWINESSTGIEADAYLVGWIAECIEKVKRLK
jgi:hypothetical protein